MLTLRGCIITAERRSTAANRSNVGWWDLKWISAEQEGLGFDVVWLDLKRRGWLVMPDWAGLSISETADGPGIFKQ